MAENFIGVFKRNDKQTAPGKEHFGHKHLMPVCSAPLLSIFGDDTMETAFLCLVLPGSMRKAFDASTSPNQDEVVNPATYRRSNKILRPAEMATALGIPDLAERLKRREKIPTINATYLNSTILKSSNKLNAASVDVAAISAGSATIGTLGTYILWAAGFADLTNLTGNLTFTQISDVIETATSSITENLNGYTFICTSSNSHYGNSTAGWLFSINHNTYEFQIQAAGIGIVEIKDINVIRLAIPIAGHVGIRLSSTASIMIKIHDILWDGNNNEREMSRLISNGPTTYYWNIVVWDCTEEGINNYQDTNVTFENINVNNCVTGMHLNGKAVTVRNCICVGNTTDFAGHNNAIGRNNASEGISADDDNWGTGSGNLPSIIVANEFASVTFTHDEFLQPKKGTIYNGGIAPSITGNTAGIRGVPRPSNTFYAIGASQLYDVDLAAGSYTVGAGGNFPTLYTAVLLMVDLTDDLTFKLVSDTTENMFLQITEDLNNHTLLFDSETPYKGDPTAGYNVTWAVDQNLFYDQAEGPGIVEIRNFKITVSGAKSTNYAAMKAAGITTGHTCLTHDILILCGNLTGTSGIIMDDVNALFHGYNILVFEPNYYGFELRAANPSSLIENCDVYSCVRGFDANLQSYTFINCRAVGASAADFYEVTFSTGNSCASGDASTDNFGTGTGGNEKNIIIANEVFSVDKTNPDFLKTKAGGVSATGGSVTVIVGNITGSRGNARPGPDGVESIGADEYLVANRDHAVMSGIDRGIMRGVL